MVENGLLVRQQKVMRRVELVAFGQAEVLAEKIRQRALAKPFPMQPPFAARRQQPIGNQNEQHQVPARAFAADRQSLSPKTIKLQLPPQAQRQPARPPLPRPVKPELQEL